MSIRRQDSKLEVETFGELITWSNTFSGLLSLLSWCDELDALLISIRGVVGVCKIFVADATQTVVVELVVRVEVLIIDVVVVVITFVFVFKGLGLDFVVVVVDDDEEWATTTTPAEADDGCSFISGNRDKSVGLLDDESI